MRTSQESLMIEEGMGCDTNIDFERSMITTHECILKKCCKKYKKKGKKPCKSCPKR